MTATRQIRASYVQTVAYGQTIFSVGQIDKRAQSWPGRMSNGGRVDFE